MSLAQDAVDLIEGLQLEEFVIGGWSIGGITAQIVLAMTGDKASHVVLLATTPPGQLVKAGEQLFYDTAAKPGTDLDQFTTVFFEPSDAASREASKRSFERIMARQEDRSRMYRLTGRYRRSAIRLAIRCFRRADFGSPEGHQNTHSPYRRRP